MNESFSSFARVKEGGTQQRRLVLVGLLCVLLASFPSDRRSWDTNDLENTKESSEMYADNLKEGDSVPPSLSFSSSSPTDAPPPSSSATSTATPTSDTRTKFYSVARTDRTGAQIFEFFMLDAYAFSQNGVVGGACVDMVDFGQNNTHWTSVLQLFEKRLQQKKSMLSLLGLDKSFKFGCPTQEEIDDKRAVVVERRVYNNPRDLFTNNWYDNLQERSTFAHNNNHSPPRSIGFPMQIAVHVRRGDYDPCLWYTKDKYLPNEYYLRALDEHLPRICHGEDGLKCNVTIYSDNSTASRRKQPVEDFTPFEQRNYTLDLNASVEDTWRAFIQADVLFVSKSSFSLVPALLNHNQVIYPPNYYALSSLNLANWSVPSVEVARASDASKSDLRWQNCPDGDVHF